MGFIWENQSADMARKALDFLRILFILVIINVFLKTAFVWKLRGFGEKNYINIVN